MTTTDLDALESAWAATTQGSIHSAERLEAIVAFKELTHRLTPALVADNRRLREENEAMREALVKIAQGALPIHTARKALEGL